jgi:hypothetical protein
MLLDFTNPVLDPRITFSRGTGATRVNASGFIEVVGNTTPRFDYDPVTLAPRGLLIEEARTNTTTYSQELDNAAWTKSNVTVTANATLAPDGTATADRVVSTAGTTAHVIDAPLTTSTAAAWTTSVYLKQDAYRYVSVGLRAFGGSGHGTAVVDLQAGVITQTTSATGISAVTSSIQNAGNGWYRVFVTGTYAGAYPSSGLELGFVSGPTPTLDAVGREVVTLTTAATFYAWGGQFETGAFATSYIPTVASTVSRSADVATMTGTNFSSWFNATQGAFVASVGSNSNSVRVLTVSDNSVTNQLFMSSSGDNIFSVYTGGAFQAMLGITPAAAYRTAGAYAANDFAACANGGTVSTDVSGSLAASYTQMAIGSNFNAGSAYLNGHIRAIAYYNTRLPNTQLQTLTAPSLASPLALDFISPTYTVGY